MQTIERDAVVSSNASVRVAEKEIILDTLNGNPNAFGYLISKYKDPLFDLAYRILGDRTSAEDVVESAFLDAYKHLAGFNYKSKFSTWVYAIVLNRARNQLRRKKIISWTSLDLGWDGNDDIRAPEMAANETSMQAHVEQKMELEAVQKELRNLPELYQAIFIMHYFQNMSLSEISDRLERPVGTVKVYLHRARKMLYKRMAQESSAWWKSQQVMDTTQLPTHSLAH